MSRLLEIIGRAITVDTADLIWHWFSEIKRSKAGSSLGYGPELDKIIELAGNHKAESAAEQLRIYLFDNPGCVYGRMVAAALWLRFAGKGRVLRFCAVGFDDLRATLRDSLLQFATGVARVPRDADARRLLRLADQENALSPNVKRFTIDVDPLEML